MAEKCGSIKGIENKLEQLVDVAGSYIKSRELQDTRWTITREHGNKISVIENKIDNLNIELHGTEKQKENGYNGICGDVRIIKAQISAFPALFEPLNKSIKEINDRNSKKDAIASWKENIPNVLLTILSIVSIVGSLINLIKG